MSIESMGFFVLLCLALVSFQVFLALLVRRDRLALRRMREQDREWLERWEAVGRYIKGLPRPGDPDDPDDPEEK